VRARAVVVSLNFEAGMELVNGAGFQPAVSGKQSGKKTPVASRQQPTGKMPVPLPSANAGFGVRGKLNALVGNCGGQPAVAP